MVSGLKSVLKRMNTPLTTAYEVAWTTPLLARPSLGHALTGWQPKRMGVSDGMDVYWVSECPTSVCLQ